MSGMNVAGSTLTDSKNTTLGIPLVRKLYYCDRIEPRDDKIKYLSVLSYRVISWENEGRFPFLGKSWNFKNPDKNARNRGKDPSSKTTKAVTSLFLRLLGVVSLKTRYQMALSL